MTIINRTLSNHAQIVESLHRLNNAILRMNSPLSEPAGSELVKTFEDFANKNEKFVDKTIDGVSTSGDLPRVSEELYNPSSNIFDDTVQTSYFAAPGEGSGFADVDDTGTEDISCTAKYKIKHDGKVYAEIKNYHHLKYTDYTGYSLVYSPFIQDSLEVTRASLDDMRYLMPSFQDNLDIVGHIVSLEYPIKVQYDSYEFKEELRTSAGVISASYPNTLKEYSIPVESLNVSGRIYELTQTTIPILHYPIPSDSLKVNGRIYDITRP